MCQHIWIIYQQSYKAILILEIFDQIFTYIFFSQPIRQIAVEKSLSLQRN